MSRSLYIRLSWAVAGALGASGLAVAILVVLNKADANGVLLVWVTGTIALVVSTVVFVMNRQNPTRLFEPLALPALYLTYALLVPLAYISLTGRGIQVMPSRILNLPTVIVMVLIIAAYYVGVGLSKIGVARSIAPAAGSYLFTSPRALEVGAKTRDLGRIILLVAVAAKVYEWVTLGLVSSRIYGADQLNYTFVTAVATIGGSLVAVGCLLVMRGNASVFGRPLAITDGLLIAAICGIDLFVLGTRSEVIAPLVLFLWFWLKCGRRLPIGWLLIAASAFAGVFLVVAQLRSRGAPESYPLIENLLVETSSPLYVTANVVQLIPHAHDFLGGSTYLASLAYMLPGPVSRALYGGVHGTGALEYRDLTNFTNRGQGWGFSLPTEAYINYGFVGVILAGLLLGFLFGRSFEWAKRSGLSNSLSAYVYPLLLSYLPFGLRSDALGQLKSTIYPLLIIWIVLLISQRLTMRSQRASEIVARPFSASLRGWIRRS